MKQMYYRQSFKIDKHVAPKKLLASNYWCSIHVEMLNKLRFKQHCGLRKMIQNTDIMNRYERSDSAW